MAGWLAWGHHLGDGRDHREGERRGGDNLEVEARVAEAVARRDFESAARALIEGYGPQVLGYLRVVVKDGEEAEDAFSLFAENVWRGLPTWQGQASARTWAYSMAWNAAERLFLDRRLVDEGPPHGGRA